MTSIHIIATDTDNIVKGCPSVKLNINGDEKDLVGRETSNFFNILVNFLDKKLEKSSFVDLVIDRSDQLGFSPKKLGIHDTKSVVSEYLEIKWGAKFTQSKYRLHLVSEKNRRYCDLLMVPDLVGYYLEKGYILDFKRQYLKLDSKPLIFELPITMVEVLTNIDLINKNNGSFQNKK